MLVCVYVRDIDEVRNGRIFSIDIISKGDGGVLIDGDLIGESYYRWVIDSIYSDGDCLNNRYRILLVQFGLHH